VVVGVLLGAQKGWGGGEAQAIRERLATGWSTWSTRSVLQQVLLPEGVAINLAFKQVRWLDEAYLREALIGRDSDDAPRIRPGLHSYDGSYTSLEISWQDLEARIQSAHLGDDLVVLLTPLAPPEMPVKLVVELGMLWNRPGTLARHGAQGLRATTPARAIEVHASVEHREDYYVQAMGPYLVLPIDGPIALSTGTPRTVAEVQAAVAAARARLAAEAAEHDDLAEAWLAIQSGIAWNLVYEPRHDRVVATVGRLWNEEYGGYCLFGWDNFFLAYMTGLADRDLAVQNVLEHLAGATEEGFIPNDNRGNGSKSFDRSQPPVGGIMVREVLKMVPERWFLESVFDPLLEWNRFWERRRSNDGLLSYGSHPAPNPFNEPATRSKRTAGYESGMDDSPMYEDVPFDRRTSTLALQDVGLTSLVIADSEALAEMAALLGRESERAELIARAQRLRKAMDRLWSEELGLYLNRRSDTGKLSQRLSPTLFYPLLAGVPGPQRARRIVGHLQDPAEFRGPWVVPSIARNDPAFPRQRYWKGAIWPPLNFLTYLGLVRAGYPEVAAEVSSKSLQLFLGEWRRQGFVSENYSAITGTGDDTRLSSDRFHSWGALMGVMAFIEQGLLPDPAAPLAAYWPDENADPIP
jgi:hypothetical protein